MWGKKTTAVARDNREPYAIITGKNRFSYHAEVRDPSRTVSTWYWRRHYYSNTTHERVVAKRTFWSRKRANAWAETKVKLIRDMQEHANYENRITLKG